MSSYHQHRSGSSSGQRRGDWRRSNNASQRGPPAKQERNLLDGLKTPALKTLSPPLLDGSEDLVRIRDVEYIGSYNWTRGSEPTILIPGSPSVWLNKATPYQVSSDRHQKTFVDVNGHHMGPAALLPLIAAVDACSIEKADEDFDWSSVDIVTDRNGLRKLLIWLGVTPGKKKEFRIDLQLAGEKTALFTRWEKKTRIMGNEGSFGHNFEKASTKHAAGCSDSTSHHRIVKYDFDGLKMVVRFEVDSCLDSPQATASHNNIEQLTSQLSKTSLSSPDGTSGSSKNTITFGKRKLAIKYGGAVIPKESIIELKTISSKRYEKEAPWKDMFSQIFLSQTPHLYLAVHNGDGLFQQIHERQLTDSEFQRTEQVIQPGLKKLRMAVEVIRDMLVEYGKHRRLSLVFQDKGIKVYEWRKEEDCLPEDFLQKFEI